MRILVLGADGYLGWPTAMHFSARGHEVLAVDSLLKRRLQRDMGQEPLTPIGPSLLERVRAWKEVTGREIQAIEGDLCDFEVVARAFRDLRPEAIVHYGQIPSAPYSMRGREEAVFTQTNNVVNNLNVRQPTAVYRFFKELGVEYLQFLRRRRKALLVWPAPRAANHALTTAQIGRASCRERV